MYGNDGHTHYDYANARHTHDRDEVYGAADQHHDHDGRYAHASHDHDQAHDHDGQYPGISELGIIEHKLKLIDQTVANLIHPELAALSARVHALELAFSLSDVSRETGPEAGLCAACGSAECAGVGGGIEACPKWQEAEARHARGEYLTTTPFPAETGPEPGPEPGPAGRG